MGNFWTRAKSAMTAAAAAWRNRYPAGVAWLGGDLDAGVVVDREAAMEIAAVCACINILVKTVGQIPLAVYNNIDRSPAYGKREYDAWKRGPNAYQTTQAWQEQVMLHLLTAGDSYHRTGYVNGYWDALYPIEDPDTVVTTLRDGREVHTIDGAEYDDRAIFHLHGPSPDGFSGRDFVNTHRQTLSLAKAVARYGGRWFANGGQMRGILIVPRSTTPDQLAAAKTAFLAAYGGDNLHAIAAYSEGTDYKQIDVDPEKAQALGTRQQVEKEIASLFDVPCWRLRGEQPPTLDARNAFYTDSIGPWLVRIAGGINKALLASSGVYAEHNTAALLRADMKSRSEAYRTLIEGRVLSPNEARARENLPPYTGGEVFVNPNTTAFNTPDNSGAGSA
jgi:HK97 family phage portal protein